MSFGSQKEILKSPGQRGVENYRLNTLEICVVFTFQNTTSALRNEISCFAR